MTTDEERSRGASGPTRRRWPVTRRRSRPDVGTKPEFTVASVASRFRWHPAVVLPEICCRRPGRAYRMYQLRFCPVGRAPSRDRLLRVLDVRASGVRPDSRLLPSLRLPAVTCYRTGREPPRRRQGRCTTALESNDERPAGLQSRLEAAVKEANRYPGCYSDGRDPAAGRRYSAGCRLCVYTTQTSSLKVAYIILLIDRIYRVGGS